MEAKQPDVDLVGFLSQLGLVFAHQFTPPVGGFGLGRVDLFFTEHGDAIFHLQVLGITTGSSNINVIGDAIYGTSCQDIRIDQDILPKNECLIPKDKLYPAQYICQVIDQVETFDQFQTPGIIRQIYNVEFGRHIDGKSAVRIFEILNTSPP